MAKLTKKLFFKNNNGEEKSIAIYDKFDNLGKDYITIQLNEYSFGTIQVSPVEYTNDVTPTRIVTQGSSELLIETSDNKIWAANYHAEDPSMLTNGGTVSNIGVKVMPPIAKGGNYYSYGTNVPTVWQVSPEWNPITEDDIISRFKINIKKHIFISDVSQFRCIVSTDLGGVNTVAVKSITANESIFIFDLKAGTYYFRIIAEDNNSFMLYHTPVFGPVTSTWSTIGTALNGYSVNIVDVNGNNMETAYNGTATTFTHSKQTKRWYYIGATSKHPSLGEPASTFSNIRYCADFCTCNSNACPCDVDFS